MSTTIDAHGRGHNSSGPAGGQFNGHNRTAPDPDDSLDIDDAADRCDQCGGPNDDGNGWNGLCGTCADQAEHGRTCPECGYDKDPSRGDIVEDDSPCADCARSTVGVDAVRIAAAQARRELPVGQQVQAVYLGGGEARNGAPDLRTVTKQNAYEMITTRDGSTRGVHLSWAGNTAERDENGTAIVSDDTGAPFVAFIPLGDGSDPIDDVLIRHPVNDQLKLAKADGLSAAALSALAQDSDTVAVHRAVAKHPNTDADTLRHLAGKADDEKTQVAIVEHPNTDWMVLDTVATNSSNAVVRWRVAGDSRTAAGTLGALSRDVDDSVRAAAARTTTSVIDLDRLAQDRDQDVRLSVASNAHTRPELLERMSHGNGFVMAQVAKNPSAPADTLRRLSEDTSTGNQTRAMVAANPSVPQDVLRRLATESDEWVRQHAAKNTALPADLLDSLSRDQNPAVRRAAAASPRLSVNRQSALAADADGHVRSMVAKNSATDPVILDRMAADRNHAVRAAVAENPRTPRWVLRHLAKEDEYVGRLATVTLADLNRADEG
ncbi:hypothetical protein [Microbacterium xylanilyticum]